FPGRGYIPQAMTHGAVEGVNLDASVKFYREGLWLDVITHCPSARPHGFKHPSAPWSIANLEVPEKNRKHLGRLERYSVTVASPASLAEAHREFLERRAEFGITEIEEIKEILDGHSFLISDLNRNWWEVACLQN